jgi:hypothetical protein
MFKKGLTHKQLGEFIGELFISWIKYEDDNIDKSWSIILNQWGSEDAQKLELSRENLELILEEMPNVYVYLIHHYCLGNFSIFDAMAVLEYFHKHLRLKGFGQFIEHIDEYDAAWGGKTVFKVRLSNEDTAPTEFGGKGTEGVGQSLQHITTLASTRALGELNPAFVLFVVGGATGFLRWLKDALKQTRLKHKL